MERRQDQNPEHKRHLDEELDEALEETFPASDPIELPDESVHADNKQPKPNR